MKTNPYNPTCIITGRKDDLQMYAIRNSKDEMVGWIFVHKELSAGDIQHEFKYHLTTDTTL